MEGKYDEAEQLYLRLHEHNRRDEEVLYLLGVLCCDLGIFSQACRFLDEALKISSRFPEATRQLAMALNGLADLDIETGKLDEAQAHLKRALDMVPNDAQSLIGLGRLALLRGNAALAESLLAQALQWVGANLDALNLHGLACLQQKKYAAAGQSLMAVLALKPQHSQARNNLGLSLYEQGRLAEAQTCFLVVLEHDPAYANARINLANTLRILGRPAEARQHLEQMLADTPDSIEVLNNLGTVWQDLGQAQPARDCLARALALSPTSPQVRWNLALSQLLLGDYAEGWTNFESRWDGCANLRGAYDKPANQAWRGESLQGKRLLLWAEQGFGDTLQFIRFAVELERQGATVIVEVQPELSVLLSTAPGVGAVVARGQTLPHYDLHCPLMSLPHRLGATLGTSMQSRPYLSADPVRATYWKTRLAGYTGRKVGVVWAGKSRLQNAELAAIDARRSIRLPQLAPLLHNTQCSFFSLQKGAAASELNEAGLPLHDFSAEWADFADTAAFIVNLDLIITVDTAVAHLAGALGQPVWLLNRHDTCWRWLLERADSPWYATLRQFRQTRAGDWEKVIAAVRTELAALCQDDLQDLKAMNKKYCQKDNISNHT
jgi:Flp pilus assembly protein TadD